MEVNLVGRWNIRRKQNMSPFQVIILGFLLVILLGSFLLMLPVATQNGHPTPFIDALFTSTSAVCVTGLVIHDTATYWSQFGQFVIIVLIQIGGLGVVTVAGAFAILSGRRIGLMQRSAMQEAIAAPKVGGVVRLIWFILRVSLIVEFIGAALLFPAFAADFGIVKGLWFAFFHSISAFCNAGFDLLGIREPFSSLTSYAANPVVPIVIALLIIIGGIGFLTWEDIRCNHFHIRKYRMQTKVILSVTGILIFLPTLYFFFFEFADAPVGERVLLSFFQAVTPRTAGFNTADLTSMSETGQSMITILMLIGGSPGSTAGGMKTTTFALLLLNVLATFQSCDDVTAFGRRIDASVIKNATTIAMMYFILFFAGGMTISVYEGLPLSSCLFEAASAVGTVGLTLGITPKLHILSQIILIILMYLGRVGGLTLIYAVFSDKNKRKAKLPLDKIIVG